MPIDHLVGMPIDKAPKTRRSQRVPREGPLPEEPPGLRGAGFEAFFHRGLSPCAGVYTVPSWPGKGGEATAPVASLRATTCSWSSHWPSAALWTRIHFQSRRVRGSLGCVMKYIVFSGQRSHGFSPLAPFIEPRQ